MPGTKIRDELYSSFTARAGLPGLDDGEIDSPVLGVWADVEEKRVRGRKTGECMLDVGNAVDLWWTLGPCAHGGRERQEGRV